MKNLFEIIKSFLIENCDRTRPLCLAMSGGPDSRCLFEILKQIRQEFFLDLHVVHIDHNYRKESNYEAEFLKKEMKSLKIPFHLKTLQMTAKSNLEDFFRIERIKFFKELYSKIKFQAIMLAHQEDDLAETVIKRVFEGANIAFFGSMDRISRFEEITFFRPFLNVLKKDILNWLKDNNIAYFIDKSNKDRNFLRARLREDVFPFLEDKFQKNIKQNLTKLSKRSYELKKYLDRKVEPYVKKIDYFGNNLHIDLRKIKEKIELRHLLKMIFRKQDLDVSSDVLENIVTWILENRANLEVNIKGAKIFIDRSHLFVLKDRISRLDNQLLKEGTFNFGIFEISVKKCNIYKQNTKWQDLLKNKSYIYVPENKYFISYERIAKFNKIWQNLKVPAILRKLVPVVFSEDRQAYDFLSGNNINYNKLNSKYLEINIKFLK